MSLEAGCWQINPNPSWMIPRQDQCVPQSSQQDELQMSTVWLGGQHTPHGPPSFLPHLPLPSFPPGQTAVLDVCLQVGSWRLLERGGILSTQCDEVGPRGTRTVPLLLNEAPGGEDAPWRLSLTQVSVYHPNKQQPQSSGPWRPHLTWDELDNKEH